jgi:hypothetical protein
MYEHKYLRVTGTWAMQIFRMIYREKHQNDKLYPIWVNSETFWEELSHYYHVINISEIDSIADNNNLKQEIIWIEVNKPSAGIPDLKAAQNKSEHISKKLVYFYREQFGGMEAIVLLEGFMLANRLINSLGARVDPVRVIKNLLKHQDYQLLFVEAEATKKFWTNFNETDNFKKLPPAEKSRILALQKQLIQHILEQYRAQPNDNNLVKHQYDQLVKIAPSLQRSFSLYAQFLQGYVDKYLNHDSTNALRIVADPEIEEHLNKFFTACQSNDLSHAVYATQLITEILQLDLSIQPLEYSFTQVVQDDYLNGYPVQGALITTYAMRAFIHALQVFPNDSHNKVAVTKQSYYELSESFEKLKDKGSAINLIQHTEEIESDTDIMFLEMHPNNVVESRQFALNAQGLLERINTWSDNKPRTIVLDITLNAFNDQELKKFLEKASPLVNAGYLNIILIQSLTKFSQLGLDKRSGGCIAIINNNGENWAKVNEKFKAIATIEHADPVIDHYFTYFAQRSDLLKLYIEQINVNVRKVYKDVLAQMNQLEISGPGRFQVTLSSDPKACYVAINMRGLAPGAESKDGIPFSITSGRIEKFSQDLLDYLFYPLCRFLDLPITARTSIGFPLTSINSAHDSLRITIGLESEEQLKQYAEILAYISFVLNRQYDLRFFFYLTPEEISKSEEKDKNYELRIKFFQEKLRQFKAMTPGRNDECIIIFDRQGDYNIFRDPITNISRQYQAKVIMKNGSIKFVTEKNGTNPPQWIEFAITVPIRGRGDIPVKNISPRELRIIAGCFTEVAYPGTDIEQNTKLIIDNDNKEVSFSSFQMINSWNSNLIYGPFKTSTISSDLFLELNDKKEIRLILGSRRYNENYIIVKHGNIKIALIDMTIEDRAFLIREGLYRIDRSIPSFSHGSYTFQYFPETLIQIQFSIESNTLIIEHDFLCNKADGVSIYHRHLGEQLTCYEVDYWGEKDPIFARFLRLMTAVYVKENGPLHTGFKARSNSYTHFLFNLGQEAGAGLFQQAVNAVLKNKDALREKLHEFQKNSTKNHLEGYHFGPDGSSSLSWPSNTHFLEADYIKNKFLIDKALQILTTVPTQVVEESKSEGESKQSPSSSVVAAPIIRHDRSNRQHTNQGQLRDQENLGYVNRRGYNHGSSLGLRK